MSFGDPNNPYGQQPGGQPGYGYPQQAPQGVPQQGYGYPRLRPSRSSAPQASAGGPLEMPGGVKAARVMLYVIGGLQLIGAILFVLSAVAVNAAKNDADAPGRRPVPAARRLLRRRAVGPLRPRAAVGRPGRRSSP